METTAVRTTPKDFFLQLALIITLYASVAAVLTLLFQVINIAFPDLLEGSRYTYYDPYSPSVRMAIASLIVIFPIHIYISRLLEKDYLVVPAKRELAIRRWLSYLTLFAAGIAIGIDLIVLINTYLGGEISTRFGLKVLSVFIVFAFVFGYYIKDLKNTLSMSSKQAFAYGASAVVLASIIAGFAYIGSPAKHRSIRFDNERVSDLQGLQWNIINYWQSKEKMPASLDDLRNTMMGVEIPTDPESGKDYEYRLKKDMTFELCADFDVETPLGIDDGYSYRYDYGKPYMGAGEGITGGQDWKHEAGRYCYERTIDPDFYPPININQENSR